MPCVGMGECAREFVKAPQTGFHAIRFQQKGAHSKAK